MQLILPAFNIIMQLIINRVKSDGGKSMWLLSGHCHCHSIYLVGGFLLYARNSICLDITRQIASSSISDECSIVPFILINIYLVLLLLLLFSTVILSNSIVIENSLCELYILYCDGICIAGGEYQRLFSN